MFCCKKKFEIHVHILLKFNIGYGSAIFINSYVSRLFIDIFPLFQLTVGLQTGRRGACVLSRVLQVHR